MIFIILGHNTISGISEMIRPAALINFQYNGIVNISPVAEYLENDDTFAGFYGMKLNSRPFLTIQGQHFLAFSTQTKNRISSFIKPLKESGITQIECCRDSSLILLDAYENFLLLKESSYKVCKTLMKSFLRNRFAFQQIVIKFFHIIGKCQDLACTCLQ